MNYKAEYASPLGVLTLISDGESIKGLWMEGQKGFDPIRWMDAEDGSMLPVMQQATTWLECYFSGESDLPTLPPLAAEGTPFQMEVWEILRTIPQGKTMCYGQIRDILTERQDKKTMSARAVGNAIARNPISIMIPCHRVVGAGNHLGGYAGGIERKIYLLSLEKAEHF